MPGRFICSCPSFSADGVPPDFRLVILTPPPPVVRPLHLFSSRSVSSLPFSSFFQTFPEHLRFGAEFPADWKGGGGGAHKVGGAWGGGGAGAFVPVWYKGFGKARGVGGDLGTAGEAQWRTRENKGEHEEIVENWKRGNRPMHKHSPAQCLALVCFVLVSCPSVSAVPTPDQAKKGHGKGPRGRSRERSGAPLIPIAGPLILFALRSPPLPCFPLFLSVCPLPLLRL